MYTTKRIIICLLFLFGLYSPTVNAHTQDSVCTSACHCGNLVIPAGIMTGHVHDKNQWMFSYRYMHMQMSGNQNGTTNISNENIFTTYLMAPDKMQMDMHMLMVMYGVTNRLTLMAMTHITYTQMSMSMFSVSSHHHGGNSTETAHHMSAQGLGDVKLSALFGIVKIENCQLIGILGVNVPTGSIAVKGEQADMLYAGQRLPYNMQLGSGSFDVLPGIGYIGQHNQVSWGAQAQAVIRTHDNNNGYRWGNELGLTTWINRQWWTCLGTSLRAEANVAGQLQGQDPTLYKYNEPAAHPYNYGGQKLNAFAGLSFRPPKGALNRQSLAFEYGLPIYQNLNGIQMSARQMINAAWSLTF